MEKLISRGAEADIYIGKWGFLDAVYKIRVKKPYMAEDLDVFLRKSRTIREAKMLRAARSFIPTPYVFYVGLKTYTIVMQFIEGQVMKNIIESKPELSYVAGQYLAKLHNNGIAHGDPNTSNMLLDIKRNTWLMIDFGLSYYTERIEDYAVDFHLFKEILNVQHVDVYEQALSAFSDGYFSASKITKDKFLNKVEEIEKRGRYARRRNFEF
ncbi:MAG: KEOPS complex kinase/ATPase Bud32 [Nitrososphaeria archaeon]